MAGTPRAGIIPVTPFQQNCTLIWSDEDQDRRGRRIPVAISTGSRPRSATRASPSRRSCSPMAISTMPAAPTNCGSGSASRSRAPHEADRYLLDSLPETGANYGIDAARAVIPDRWLAEGDTVSRGRARLRHPARARPFARQRGLRQPRRALRPGGRRGVQGLGRPHRPARRQHTTSSSAPSRTRSCRWATTSPSFPATAPTSTLGEERMTNPFLQE